MQWAVGEQLGGITTGVMDMSGEGKEAVIFLSVSF